MQGPNVWCLVIRRLTSNNTLFHLLETTIANRPIVRSKPRFKRRFGLTLTGRPRLIGWDKLSSTDSTARRSQVKGKVDMEAFTRCLQDLPDGGPFTGLKECEELLFRGTHSAAVSTSQVHTNQAKCCRPW